jgi:hypothetical protein
MSTPGNAYYAPPPPMPPPAPVKKKRKWPWIVAGVVLFLIIVGQCGHHSDTTSTSGQSKSTAASNAPASSAAAAPTTPQGPKSPANANISPPPGPDVDVVTARYKIGESLTKGLTKDGARIDTENILKYIKAAYPNLTEVHVFGTADMVDQYGNTSDDQVVTLTYSRATMDKINFNNVLFQNIWNIADDSWVHPAFRY